MTEWRSKLYAISLRDGTFYIDSLGSIGRLRSENAEGNSAPVVIDRPQAKHTIAAIAEAFDIDLAEITVVHHSRRAAGRAALAALRRVITLWSTRPRAGQS